MLQNRLHVFVARLTVPQRIDFYCPSRKAIPYDVNKQVSTYKFSKLCKRSIHVSFGDYCINSHNLFSWLYIDIVKRKFMWVIPLSQALNGHG